MYDYSSGKDAKIIYSRRQRLEKIRAQLEIEFNSFKSHWRDLSDFILPRRSRFFITDVNKGDRRTQKILDSTATLAVRTLKAGMTSGITSPVRPWFNLTLSDKDLSETESVKEWLYGDIGTFATGAMLVEKDYDNVIHCYSFPIGSYKIANDKKNMVKKFQRDFQMTVEQVVQKFGRDHDTPEKINWDNISEKVKSLWYTNNTEAWVQVTHIIEHNPMFDPTKLESKYKKFSSIYYERGSTNVGTGGTSHSEVQNKFLSERGYDYFPVLCPRWELTGEDVYGTNCPGMTALGDIKQLQTGERRSLQAIEKMINPPMTAPTALRNQKASILPGDITYTDVTQGQRGFQPAHEVNFNVQTLEHKQQQVRERINKAFYVDLFLMLSNSDRRQITATEIQERHEEKLLALGPVLEQLNQDLLDPLIEITFNLMQEFELIPPPPEELKGKEVKVEYTSVMAQAQKLVGIGAINNFTNFVGGVAQFNPEVLDKINTDKLVDTYGDIVSIPSGIVRSDEDVQALRQQRAEAQQAQAQQDQMAQQAQTAQALGQTKVEEGSALEALTNEVLGG